jgi:multiple sugar transport system substrate-binding protein
MQTKNRMSRRQFLHLAATASAGLALAACAPAGIAPAGPQESGSAPASGQGAPAVESITLAHWQHHSASRAQTVEGFKASFEEENSNVTIDFQSVPWAEYWGKLASAIAAGRGSAPDIFQIPMGLVEEYIDGGNLAPVSELAITSEEIEENYLPWTVQRGKRGAEYYGLPLDVQTLLIYRNNQLYEEAGLDPAAPFTDHADLYEQAVALTKKTGDQADQIGCDTSYYSAWQTILYQQFLQREQNGKPWIDPKTNQLVYHDHPEIFEIFEWFLKLSEDTDDNAFMTGQNRFALGLAGMTLNHPVGRGTLKAQAPDLEYTIVPFASRTAGQHPYTAGSHWMWVVGTWAADHEVAWKWVTYGTNRDAQIAWSQVGGDLPSFKDLVDDPQFRQTENDNVVMDSLSYASPWEWVGWAEWVKEFGDARDRVVIGGEDAQSSFDTMVENLNKVIDNHTPKR